MSEIRVSFGALDDAEASIRTTTGQIEQNLDALGKAIEQLAVWDGAAADLARQQQLEARTTFGQMNAQLTGIGTATRNANADYQAVNQQVTNMWS